MQLFNVWKLCLMGLDVAQLMPNTQALRERVRTRSWAEDRTCYQFGDWMLCESGFSAQRLSRGLWDPCITAIELFGEAFGSEDPGEQAPGSQHGARQGLVLDSTCHLCPILSDDLGVLTNLNISVNGVNRQIH